jgi:hypothetical protein
VEDFVYIMDRRAEGKKEPREAGLFSGARRSEFFSIFRVSRLLVDQSLFILFDLCQDNRNNIFPIR